MATNWITAARGIRYRRHPIRKHGARLDRYFTLRFSVGGKQVEEALGWASEGWTVAKAQDKLAELRKAQRTGQGAATLREEAEANRRAARQRAEEEAALARRLRTVGDLWDRYAKEVVAVENKPSTVRQKTRMWTRRIAPAIGHMPIAEVTEEDAGAVVRAPLRLDTAGRVIGVSEPKVNRRERLLTGGEVGALMKALDAAEANWTECPQTVAVIRAVILTGARISELLSLRWSDIRRDEIELHLRDSKTGFSRRPISTAALAVLDNVERMPGVEYVFRAVKEATAPIAYNTVEKAFGRIVRQAGVKRCTLHTLRHWFATMTANSVSNARVGMALTGHKTVVTYMGYVHSDKEQARALAEQLAALASGLAEAAPNVVALALPRTVPKAASPAADG